MLHSQVPNPTVFSVGFEAASGVGTDVFHKWVVSELVSIAVFPGAETFPAPRHGAQVRLRVDFEMHAVECKSAPFTSTSGSGLILTFDRTFAKRV